MSGFSGLDYFADCSNFPLVYLKPGLLICEDAPVCGNSLSPPFSGERV